MSDLAVSRMRDRFVQRIVGIDVAIHRDYRHMRPETGVICGRTREDIHDRAVFLQIHADGVLSEITDGKDFTIEALVIGSRVVHHAPAGSFYTVGRRLAVHLVDAGLEEVVPVKRTDRRQRPLDVLPRVGYDDRVRVALAEEAAQEIVQRKAPMRLFADLDIGAQPDQGALVVVILSAPDRRPPGSGVRSTQFSVAVSTRGVEMRPASMAKSAAIRPI